MRNGNNKTRLALLLGIAVFSFGLWEKQRRTATGKERHTFAGTDLAGVRRDPKVNYAP